MKLSLLTLCMFAMMAAACSSPEPPRRFLYAQMVVPYTADDGKKAENLRIRPVDLYNIFDTNVKKKWKKNHENSWSIIIDGRNTATGKVKRMVITLLVDPELNDAVVVKEILESGRRFSDDETSQLTRTLDKAFNPMR